MLAVLSKLVSRPVCFSAERTSSAPRNGRVSDRSRGSVKTLFGLGARSASFRQEQAVGHH
jgi:hypothetical protein